MASQAHHELHVLAHGLHVTIRVEQALAPEEAKRSRDQEVATESIPTWTSEQKGAQVLDRLDAGESAVGTPFRRQPAL